MQEKGEEKIKALVNRYIKAYQEKIDLYKKYRELLKELESLEKQETILKDIMSRCYGKTREAGHAKQQCPIILGSSLTRMSVISLGKLPEKEWERFHSQNAIYPIGYTMRRKYYMHKYYQKKSKNKVTYTCTITKDDVFSIKADDNHRWSGKDCWEKFKSDFDTEMVFKDVEDFFGFTHITLMHLIEGLGDISRFRNYIPVAERKTNQEKA